MGVLLEMDNTSATNMLMDIAVSKFWSITRVESKSSCTGAYTFRQQRLVDCTDLLDEINCVDGTKHLS